MTGSYQPSLRTLFLVVSLIVLLLPLGGIAVLRLYETSLVQRTESALIGQGALVAAAYREELSRQFAAAPGGEGIDPGNYGNPLDPKWQADGSQLFTPIQPQLDMASSSISGPAETAVAPAEQADRFARAAGRALTPVLSQAKTVSLSGIRIVDHQGTVVASSGTELGLSLIGRQEVPRALAGEPLSLLRQRISDEPPPAIDSLSRRTRVRAYVALPVVSGDRVWGAVVLSRTPLDMQKALYNRRRTLLLGSAVLLAAVLLITLLTTFAVTRPMRQLVRQAVAVTRGQRDAARPLASPGTREVARLSEAISNMAAALQERADYIRTFAANVSHEFKAPLTSLKGAGELFRDHLQEMNPEELDRFLRIMEADVERLDRLVNRLLELARADMASPGNEACAPGPILRALAGRYRDAGLEVTVEGPGSGMRAAMPAAAFESLFSILLDNTLQHAGAGRSAAITLSPAAGGQGLEARYTDDGPGIPAAAAEKVFEPFFTTAREQGGSGLGLAIVRTLLAAHRGGIELLPSDGGARFVIRLPAPTSPA
jgi:signal transduction histidine kinase